MHTHSRTHIHSNGTTTFSLEGMGTTVSFVCLPQTSISPEAVMLKEECLFYSQGTSGSSVLWCRRATHTLHTSLPNNSQQHAFLILVISHGRARGRTVACVLSNFFFPFFHLFAIYLPLCLRFDTGSTPTHGDNTQPCTACHKALFRDVIQRRLHSQQQQQQQKI